jgi:hypothetical protein
MTTRFVLTGPLVILLLLGCQNEPPPAETRRAPAVSPTPVVAASAAVSPREGPVVAAAQHAAETPYPGQDINVGKWVEASAYKFKVSAVRPCPETKPAAGAPEDRPLRVAVSVHVFSKYDQLFVTPRDVKLESKGVIIESERDAKASTGCGPLLEAKHVQHDQTTSGVVVFRVPNEEFVKEGVATFQAVRWGGAPRVEIKLAEAEFRAEAAAAP